MSANRSYVLCWGLRVMRVDYCDCPLNTYARITGKGRCFVEICLPCWTLLLKMTQSTAHRPTWSTTKENMSNLFVYLTGFCKNRWTDHHKTWWKDAVWVRDEPTHIWCWPGSRGRRLEIFFSLLTFLLISQRIIHGSRWKNLPWLGHWCLWVCEIWSK